MIITVPNENHRPIAPIRSTFSILNNCPVGFQRYSPPTQNKPGYSQRNRRERPVCRSGKRCEYNLCGWMVPSTDVNVAKTTRADKTEPTSRAVIPTEMKWSGGIYSSCRLYLTQIIIATWEDSSTPLTLRSEWHIGGWVRVTTQVIIVTFHGGAPRSESKFIDSRGNHTLIPSMNHRRYIGWFHLSARVIFATLPTISLMGPLFQPEYSKMPVSFTPFSSYSNNGGSAFWDLGYYLTEAG